MPKKITYLKSYVGFGSTSSKQMMFKFLSFSFAPKCLVKFCKLASLHPTHTYMTTTCLCRPIALDFRAVGTLPILGFVSEGTLGLEAAYCVAFAIAKGKKPHTIGE